MGESQHLVADISNQKVPFCLLLISWKNTVNIIAPLFIVMIHRRKTENPLAINFKLKKNCNSFVMTYVGVKCLTRHCSVLRDTRTRGTT